MSWKVWLPGLCVPVACFLREWVCRQLHEWVWGLLKRPSNETIAVLDLACVQHLSGVLSGGDITWQ